jgi:carbonic anhydrase
MSFLPIPDKVAYPPNIVCGHTDCGVMRDAFNPEALELYPNVIAWLKYAWLKYANAEHREADPTPEFLLRLAKAT